MQTLRALVNRVPWRNRWLPLAAMLVFAHVVLLGPFLLTRGLPRGGDMGVNMVTGYVAENSTWHQLWDDSRFPGQSKHVSRFSISDLALMSLVRLTDDLFLSMRLMVWAFHVIAMVGMYLFVYKTTGSRVAGAIAGLVFVLSRGAPLRAITAMMAGFALIPLLFLAVDRFLVAPSWRRALLLALAMALYATASIPPFTYIVGLALVVYVGAFFASKGLAAVGGAINHRLFSRSNGDSGQGVRPHPDLPPEGEGTVPSPSGGRSGWGRTLSLPKGWGRTPLSYAGLGLAAILATLLLSAYFIAGLSMSTAPLVEESGGYSLESLASGRPSLYEALLFYRGSPEYNTLPSNVAIWMLVIAAFATPLLRFNWRVAALVIIAAGGAIFASDVNSPVYTFLYDNLPYFSSVRGTRRWMTLSLFSFSVLLGVGIAYALERWRGLSKEHSPIETLVRWLRTTPLYPPLLRGGTGRSTRIAAGLVIALIGVAALNVFTQLPSVRAWLEPYELSEEYVSPYLWLKDTPEGTTYATTPFLAKRLRDESYIQGVASGKMAGPGISGRPAFGVFQSGGAKVNEAMFDLVREMKAFPTYQYDALELKPSPVSLAQRPLRGPRMIKEFLLSGFLTVDEFEDPAAFIRLRFHRFREEDSEGFHALDLYPELGRMELRRVGPSGVSTLASAPLPGAASREYELSLLSRANKVEVWIGGEQLLTASISRYSGGDVQISSSGGEAFFRDVELSVVTGALDPDYSMAAILGLFNVSYLVVQPHTSDFERQRVNAVPGFKVLGQWGASVLYENEYFLEGKAFFTPHYGVYVGDPVSVVHGLYQLDPVARNKVPLLGISDLPPELAAEVFSRASFIVVDGTREIAAEELTRFRELQARASIERNQPPTVYSWDLSQDGVVLSSSDSPAPPVAVGAVPIVLGRGKDFVLEATLRPTQPSANVGATSIRFRVRNEQRYYEARIEPSSRQATLSFRDGRRVETLAQAEVSSLNGADLSLRLSAVTGRLMLHLGGQLVLDTTDDRIDKGGPIQLTSEGGGALLTSPRFISGDVPAASLEIIAERGLSHSELATRFDNLRPEDLPQLGYTQLYATKLAHAQPGVYRLLVRAEALRHPSVRVWLDNDVSSEELVLNTLEALNGTIQQNGVGPLQWWLASPPIELAGPEARLMLATSSPGIRFIQALLVEAPEGRAEAGLDVIFSSSSASALNLERLSPTQYRGGWDVSQSGILVFQDAFHPGWQASLGVERLPHFRAFGTLNGYWVSSEATIGVEELELEFIPQRRYQRALAVSGVAFLLVVGALVAPPVWQWLRGRNSRR